MRRFAYGRRPPVLNRRVFRSAMTMFAALDPLGPPPANSNDYVSTVIVPWGLYANDTLGDCTICDSAHSLMLRTANASQIVIPSIDDVRNLYFQLTGGADTGLEENTVCNYMVATGWLGHKAAATADLDPSNINHAKWGIQLFGSVRIGLNLPGYAEDQFENGQPWDVNTQGDQTTDGHDVPLVKYDGTYFYCVTWGQLCRVTPAFLLKYCEEAHVELFPDWIRAQGEAPPGFDLADLTTKLKEVA